MARKVRSMQGELPVVERLDVEEHKRNGATCCVTTENASKAPEGLKYNLNFTDRKRRQLRGVDAMTISMMLGTMNCAPTEQRSKRRRGSRRRFLKAWCTGTYTTHERRMPIWQKQGQKWAARGNKNGRDDRAPTNINIENPIMAKRMGCLPASDKIKRKGATCCAPTEIDKRKAISRGPCAGNKCLGRSRGDRRISQNEYCSHSR